MVDLSCTVKFYFIQDSVREVFTSPLKTISTAGWRDIIYTVY